MLKESSNNNNKSIFSETSSISKEKIICKDGFCSLPNQDDIPKQDSNDMNSVSYTHLTLPTILRV